MNNPPEEALQSKLKGYLNQDSITRDSILSMLKSTSDTSGFFRGEERARRHWVKTHENRMVRGVT